MLTTVLENIDGTIYNVINDKTVCDELHKQIGFLKVKNIKYNFHSKEAHHITVAYRSEHGALLLTKIENINISIMHLLKADKFIITNHRFDPKLYRGIILYGDIYKNKFAIHAVKFDGYSERIGDNLEKFDQILFNQYKEDTDLEPLSIVIKEFYASVAEIPHNKDHKGILYLNPVIGSIHYLEFINTF